MRALLVIQARWAHQLGSFWNKLVRPLLDTLRETFQSESPQPGSVTAGANGRARGCDR
jgi:hypothetical protein